jgi:hydrogenase nickel incorporation protein HypB
MADRRTVIVEAALLGANDERAADNRRRFAACGVTVVNLLSSPGSGKTTLLARTLADLGPRLRSAVIVGDLATDLDAQRLRAAGIDAVQIATGGTCHLEAGMVAEAAGRLDLTALDLLVIENVGNLVCPASFDLGEAVRVVLVSVTEGEDKPLKYPVAFKSAHAAAVTKIDLATVTGFDRDRALAAIRAVAPQAALFEVSARTGDGLDGWYRYLMAEVDRRAGRVRR